MPADPHQPARSIRVGAIREGQRAEREDVVAVEEPLEIRVGDEAVAVTMRTPGHDLELAVGFLYTEGVFSRPEQLVSVEYDTTKRGAIAPNIVRVALDPGTPIDIDRCARNFYATSSCGICGKASIEQVRQRITPIDARFSVSPALISSLPDRMRDAQRVFGQTGGLHAAALFDADGTLLCLREDVGRHNAVDKVVGWAVRAGGLPLTRHLLMISGRASFEIVQKAAVARIPIVTAVSAPSSLAVDLAREAKMTLVGFLRGTTMNIYAGGERIAAGS